MTDSIGFVSTLCICVTLAPQIAAIVRTGNVAGLSLWSYVVYTIGNGAGLIYGLRIASPPVTVTSVITLATSAAVLVLILIKRRRNATHA
jgi:uncharacterized protein with PQ loop repeat